MSDFYEVWLRRGTVLAKLECMLEAREAAREQELKAATDIKRVYRGKVSGNNPSNDMARAVLVSFLVL